MSALLSLTNNQTMSLELLSMVCDSVLPTVYKVRICTWTCEHFVRLFKWL